MIDIKVGIIRKLIQRVSDLLRDRRQKDRLEDLLREPIILDEEFRRAKRNLLWASSGIFLFSLARARGNSDIALHELAMPVFGNAVVFDRTLLSAFFLLLIWFLLARFRYEIGRIIHLKNSKVAKSDKAWNGDLLVEVEEHAKEARDEILSVIKSSQKASKELQEIRKKYEFWTRYAKDRDALIKLEVPRIKKLKQVVLHYVRVAQEIRSDTPDDNASVQTAMHLSAYAEDLTNEIDTLIFIATEPPDPPPDEIQDEPSALVDSLSTKFKAVEDLSERLTLEATEYLKLHDNLRGADRFMFKWHDSLIPQAMSALAIIGCLWWIGARAELLWFT